MLDSSVFAARRQRLHQLIEGPVLLLGNGTRARNLPMNELPFRQDSSFLYFTGCALPEAAAWIEDGKCTLFLPQPAEDDPLWHGHVDSLEDLGCRFGVDETAPLQGLDGFLAGKKPRTLAIADEARNRQLVALTGRPHAFGRDHGDPELVAAIIRLRRTKTALEVDEMRRIAALSAEAHCLLMAATRPGVHERSLAALFEAFLASRGCSLGYQTILTQRGEILHNHAHDAVLAAGKLLLLDGGGELDTGYGADITRTWPVSGRYTPRQRAAYDAVLEAHHAAIAKCTAGTRYREVHDAACRVLARFLIDEGLLRNIAVDEAVERGAHALFFPHGVGHLLGMDVHDLENFGDLPSYAAEASRPEPFGTCYLRLDLPLEPGWVVTVEPGFYVVPAILQDATLRERFADVFNPDAAAAWTDFGGIRIEDDIVVTDSTPENLSASAPTHPDAIETLVGSGARLEVLLS